MKTKQLLPFLLLLLITSITFAQTKNPFASIGKKGKILTLTKGQYDENFDNDSIQQIGSSLINVRSMKVVKLLTIDESKKRLETEKHSRFLSIDPLTSSFPMLTPYQYASNRPIDGIDLDGLEYVVYYVLLRKDGTMINKAIAQDFRNMTNDQIKNIHHWKNPENFYKLYSQSFGPEGQGVKYIYFYWDEKAKNFTNLGESWEVRQDGIGDKLGRNGMYSGPGCVTVCGGSIPQVNGKGAFGFSNNPYDFKIRPNDEQDAAAKKHDMTQDKMSNYKGFLEDSRTLESDYTLVKDCQDYLSKIKANPEYVDQYTNRKYSQEALTSANQTVEFFQAMIRYKEWKVKRLNEMGKDPTKAENQLKVNLDDYKGSNSDMILLRLSGGRKDKE